MNGYGVTDNAGGEASSVKPDCKFGTNQKQYDSVRVIKRMTFSIRKTKRTVCGLRAVVRAVA